MTNKVKMVIAFLGIVFSKYQFVFAETNIKSSDEVFFYVKEIIVGIIILTILSYVYHICVRKKDRYIKDAFKEKDEFLKSIVENNNAVVYVWKVDGTLIYSNKFAEQVTKFAEAEIQGYKWKDKLFDKEGLSHMNEIFKMFGEGIVPSIYEGYMLSKSGAKNYFLWNNNIIFNKRKQPKLVVSIGMDVTERRESEEVMRKMAYYDNLTELPNRVMFNNMLEKEFAISKENNRNLAVAFIDLDNFKSINDSLGHSTGDELLVIMADIIKSCLRDEDVVARLGGDEFICMLPNIKDKNTVVEIVSNMLNRLKKPLILDQYEHYATASIGIAMYPEDGQNTKELLNNADIAMYSAKRMGKSDYKLYSKEMNIDILERLELENGLRNALIKDEFIVFYQPQVNLNSCQITGMEALIRWQHPQRGMVAPMEFIPLAEETGLIVSIGRLVLYKACMDNKKWQESGYPPMRVSVNLSARQFDEDDIVEMIESVLKETGLEPKWLELEITETIAMKDFERTINILDRLNKMGIKVSLDDFGTGYSSLNYLKRLPIDTLKIDKTFLENLQRDSNEEIITTSVIDLARKMKLSIIAEGVENITQLNFLRKHECNKAQGYLFSRPLPREDFEEILEENRILFS